MDDIRNKAPIVDGIFYPQDKELLNRQIVDLLGDNKSLNASSKVIMVPHAGYKYTGKLSAEGFKTCIGLNIKNVVLLAPVTRDADDGIFLCSYSCYETPLGKVEIARDKVDKLLNCKGRISTNDFPFTEEHSIEVQLPFIQHLFPEAKIIPIHMGRQNAGTVKQLSKALKSVFKDEMESTLFVVSGNLSPYTKADIADEYAKNLLNLVQNADYDTMLKSLQDRDLLPNSAGCLIASIGIADTKPEVKVLGTSDSGGDKVVCYGALSISF